MKIVIETNNITNVDKELYINGIKTEEIPDNMVLLEVWAVNHDGCMLLEIYNKGLKPASITIGNTLDLYIMPGAKVHVSYDDLDIDTAFRRVSIMCNDSGSTPVFIDGRNALGYDGRVSVEIARKYKEIKLVTTINNTLLQSTSLFNNRLITIRDGRALYAHDIEELAKLYNAKECTIHPLSVLYDTDGVRFKFTDKLELMLDVIIDGKRVYRKRVSSDSVIPYPEVSCRFSIVLKEFIAIENDIDECIVPYVLHMRIAPGVKDYIIFSDDDFTGDTIQQRTVKRRGIDLYTYNDIGDEDDGDDGEIPPHITPIKARKIIKREQ